MADVIEMWDGNIQTVFSIDDFLYLADEYMGFEAKRWLENYITDIETEYGKEAVEDLEGCLQEAKGHHKEVMRELRKLSEEEAGLISAKEIDRKRLSNAAGQIGAITWREINAV